MGTDLEIRILGPLEVERDGRLIDLGAPKQRAVMADLVLHADEVVPVERLIDDVWGDDAPRTASHSVQIYVSELRKAIGDVISREANGYALHVGTGVIDAGRFEELVDQGLGADDPGEAARFLEEAVTLWRGPTLADVAYHEFAQADIRRLEELHIAAVESLAAARLRLGMHDRVVPWLQPFAETHPFRERLWAMYIRALYGSGRQADALRAYGSLRTALAEELGIDPTPELRRLEEQILLQDPELEPPVSVVSGEPTNPYKGLQPFGEDDASGFYGRDQLIAELDDAVASSPFVAVVGASGAGKSSVVRAGLLPTLRSEFDRSGSHLAVMVPGSDPDAALCSALETVGLECRCPRDLPEVVSDGEELLLIIDQFEELFTLVDDTAMTRRFLEGITEAVATGRIRVVATLRADHYDGPLAYPDFAKVFTSGVIHVMPLTAKELEEAAVRPARGVGLEFEPALLAELVADVAGEPGALPLFQYALTELFERRTGPVLDLATYRDIGGLHGALVGRVETVFGALSTDEQEAARQLSLRLVTVGPTAASGRRRVPGAELTNLDVDQLALQRVIQELGDHRLLTFDRDPHSGRPTLELAHEALMSTWPRLRDWLETAASDLRRHAPLAAAAAEWDEADRDPDYLPTGRQLAEYEAWTAATSMRLTNREQAYVDAAVDKRDAASRQEAARREAEAALQRRARVRLWSLVAVIAVVVATAAAIAWIVVAGRGPNVAIIHGGRGDSGFWDMLAQGWDDAVRDLTFQETEVIGLFDNPSEMRELAEAGNELILAGGASFTPALAEVAPDYPDTTFVMIDMVVDAPNVTSFVFAEHEGSFLAGAAAALATETGTVGFVGGAPFDFINRFRAGFEQGVAAVDPSIEVLAIHLFDSPDWNLGAFARADLGFAAAGQLYGRGADVIYHAAGFSGWGVVDAARALSTPQQHLWAIGVDVDQYLVAEDIHRAHLLTSMVKRVDVATYRGVQDYVEDRLEPGVVVLGVADEALTLAQSGGYLEPHLDEIETLRGRIIDGSTIVATSPSGDVIPAPVIEADIEIRGGFVEGECLYEGPESFAADQLVQIFAGNGSNDRLWIGLMGVDSGYTHDDVEENPSGPPPAWIDFDRMYGVEVEAGGFQAGTHRVPEGTYVWVCTFPVEGGVTSYPVATIEVR